MTTVDKTVLEYENYVTHKITLRRYINEQLVPLSGGKQVLDDSTGHIICPFHNETNASFTYWSSTDTCYCFGCGAAGDLLAIHRRRVLQFGNRRINRLQAAHELVQLYGLEGDAEIRRLREELQHREGATADQRTTVFSEARYKLLQPTAVQPEQGALTLTSFRKTQERIMKHQSVYARCELLNDLDIRAGITITAVRNGEI